MSKCPKLGNVNDPGLKPGAQMVLDIKRYEYASDMGIRLRSPNSGQGKEINKKTGTILLTSFVAHGEGCDVLAMMMT